MSAPDPSDYQQVDPSPPFEAPGFFGYGGFWLRFGATIVDILILQIIQFALQIVTGLEQPAQIGATWETARFLGIGTLVSGVYEVLAVASVWQATPGKLIWGLKVVDRSGNRISLLRSLGRFFGKYLSSLILCIGYLMVAFDARKRGLHDRLAGTYVIKSRSSLI
jgi:uncharacterized RDD family membrane protein YckC